MTKTDEVLKACPFCGIELSGPEGGAYGHPIGSPDCILAYVAVDRHDFARWNQRASIQPADDAVVEDFLHELDGWESAYPLSAFPEPNLKKAAELLKAGGMTLDAVSASNMRHVVRCIAPKARAAIAALASPQGEKGE